jgi:Winged helix-turn helix
MKTERFSPEQVIAALQRSHGTITEAARTLGCSAQTVRNYVDRYEDVRAVLDDARDRLLDVTELQLYAAVQRGEPWAIRLVVTTLGHVRGYTSRHEITGKNGEQLPGPVIYIPQEDPMPGMTEQLLSTPEGEPASTPEPVIPLSEMPRPDRTCFDDDDDF